MLADPCADPGIFARVVQARLPENSSDNGFCLFFVLNFYSFTVGGGGVANLFQGGRGLGVQMLILETHRTFDFSRRGCGPYIPLWIRTCDNLRGSRWKGSGIHYSLKN